MRFGVTLPNGGYGGDPATLIQLAVDAEQAGWD
ncbi:MAG: LLM class flavin-dependent oxidoreductase, partial [Dehalococcoidia bacterium]|nr:LLM class flavin-dependent oxidoreductase [Dehalococcoidia bacterium]